jgi:hypothetical protein
MTYSQNLDDRILHSLLQSQIGGMDHTADSTSMALINLLTLETYIIASGFQL